jgi:tetratricopeptide (TPR) repeat protein
VAAGPGELPAADWHFTGRAAELRVLTQALARPAHAGSPTVGTIWGRAGAGKTALALRWADQAAAEFPDGQLYASLRGSAAQRSPASTAEVIRGFLDALDVPAESVPADLESQLGLYRDLVAGRRMLIVLDDARDSAQVEPLLPAGDGCCVLVTSARRLDDLTPGPAAVLNVDELPPGDARELVLTLLGSRGSPAGPQLADQVVGRCGGLPLTLLIACARLSTWSDARLAAGVAELALTSERASESGQGSVTDAVAAWSYGQLEDPAATLFRLLSVCPGIDLAAAAVASLAGLEIDVASRAVAELAALRLLTLDRRGRGRLRGPLAAIAADLAGRADTPGVLHAARRRLLDHYLHTAHEADQLLFPHRLALTIGDATAGVRPERLSTPDEALCWFAAEHRTLLAVISIADAEGFDTHAWQLTSCVAMYLDLTGHWQDFSDLQRTAITAAGRLGDLDGLARSHHAYAHACVRLGRNPDAMTEFERALGLYRASGDRAGQGSVHLGMSQLHCREGSYAAALPHARQALALYTSADDHNGHAQALNQLGWSLAHLGALEPAIEYCHQALGMYGPGESRAGEPQTWDSLGYAYHRLGDYRLAISCYEQAMTLWRAIGDRYDQALTLVRLGEVHDSAADQAAAEAAWRDALAIFHELKHPQAADVQARLRSAPRPRGLASQPGA